MYVRYQLKVGDMALTGEERQANPASTGHDCA